MEKFLIRKMDVILVTLYGLLGSIVAFIVTYNILENSSLLFPLPLALISGFFPPWIIFMCCMDGIPKIVYFPFQKKYAKRLVSQLQSPEVEIKLSRDKFLEIKKESDDIYQALLLREYNNSRIKLMLELVKLRDEVSIS